jgi:hypothetical protein
MIKKIVGVLIVVLLVLGGGVLYLGANLDGLIKKAVETYGTEATQAKVTLASVKIELTDGKGTLQGLKVANPEGFSTGDALSLGAVTLQIDPSSIKGTGPIVIQKIAITKPQILYEVSNSGANNLTRLSDNAKAYVKAQTGGAAPAAKTAAEEPKAKTKAASNERKIIIDDLTIADAQVSIHQALLPKPLSATLPTVHLTKIGAGQGGVTPAEAGQILLQAISAQTVQTASASMMQELTNLKSTGNLKDVGKEVGSKIKGMIGF